MATVKSPKTTDNGHTPSPAGAAREELRAALAADPAPAPAPDNASHGSMRIEFGGEDALTAIPRKFSTGSTGYYASGKIRIHGRWFQVTCNVVLIGSKPGSASKRNA